MAKTQDRRIGKLLTKIGKVAKLSLDYSFMSTEQEIVGVYYDASSVKEQMLDGIPVLVPDNGVAFLILTMEEFENPDVKSFAEQLKKSYKERKDYE